jgi:hypothetical protein
VVAALGLTLIALVVARETAKRPLET